MPTRIYKECIKLIQTARCIGLQFLWHAGVDTAAVCVMFSCKNRHIYRLHGQHEYSYMIQLWLVDEEWWFTGSPCRWTHVPRWPSRAVQLPTLARYNRVNAFHDYVIMRHCSIRTEILAVHHNSCSDENLSLFSPAMQRNVSIPDVYVYAHNFLLLVTQKVVLHSGEKDSKTRLN